MEQFRKTKLTTQTSHDQLFKDEIGGHFDSSNGSTLDKLNCFARFVSRQTLSTFLLKVELFKRIVSIHGHVIECGVHSGGGLMTWAQLSSIFEPINHTRRIYGFDTFEGFPSIHEKDTNNASEDSKDMKNVGSLSFNYHDDLLKSVELYDVNRPLGHIPKVELVKGDALITIPEFIKVNPSLVVSLLYLDFDLYEPTKTALEYFVPRMPKGSVIAFDELNQKDWPGETIAVNEVLGIKNLRIQRSQIVPQISFAVL